MIKKTQMEADLDPPGTRHTRPGGKVAETALANTKPAPAKRKRERDGDGAPTRPGATAAARAVEDTKRKP